MLKRFFYQFYLLVQSTLLYLLLSPASTAQIIPDDTLPNNSIVPLGCTTCEIIGGTRVGNNLFHSFRQFSIPTEGTAYFNHASTVDNIFSRVTGRSVSTIDGLIRANGANVFLLNPNGIIFGRNASLDIGGSFLATTAEQIDFVDGTQFSATNLSASSLLTVSVPSGLQFGSNPGTIRNASVALDEDRNQVGLQVSPGQTLALIGGSISFPGGYIAAPSGRIELGSVGSNSSVRLLSIPQGWRLSYNTVQAFRDVVLSQGAFVDASSDTATAGDILIQGRIFVLAMAAKPVLMAMRG
jgi:filamentous hemagglutinin family protein